MDQSYIGAIVLVAFNFAPQNWAFCNGQLLPISQYNALFALLGATYGGDGQTNFALPKLNGDALLPGLNYMICLNGIFPSRP
jgi:microcystin-dependent protein